MKNNILMIICFLLAILSVGYCIVVKAAGSGTLFFAIWILISVFFIILGLGIYFGLWKLIPVIVRRIILILFAVFFVSFVIVEGMILSKFNSAGKENLDYIIVLGAQVRENGPSVVLKYRLDKAKDYLENNENTVCILSGGKGANEPFSEAEGMASYLEQKGISKDRLILETKSETTVQNIQNSMIYIKEGASVGVVTNNFHVFRAMQIAKKQGIDNVYGISADSSAAYLPNNMLREYFAEIKLMLQR